MKWVIYLLMGLLLINIVCADYKSEIREQAKLLEGNTSIKTVENIDRWVQRNITHKPFDKHQRLDTVWRTRIGDCTDKATIKMALLTELNISTRPVHGYTEGGKHDWFEYCLICNRTRFIKGWDSIEQKYFRKKLHASRGFW